MLKFMFIILFTFRRPIFKLLGGRRLSHLFIRSNSVQRVRVIRVTLKLLLPVRRVFPKTFKFFPVRVAYNVEVRSRQCEVTLF